MIKKHTLVRTTYISDYMAIAFSCVKLVIRKFEQTNVCENYCESNRKNIELFTRRLRCCFEVYER